MITASLRVRAFGRGNGFERTQVLEKSWSFCGVKIWKKTVDTEEVPTFAVIQHCTLGSTEWKSKWHGMAGVKWA